jgi:hypothetical protein
MADYLYTAGLLRDQVAAARLPDDEKEREAYVARLFAAFRTRVSDLSKRGVEHDILPPLTRTSLKLGAHDVPHLTDEFFGICRRRLVTKLRGKDFCIAVAGQPGLTPAADGTISGRQVPLIVWWGTPAVPYNIQTRYKTGPVPTDATFLPSGPTDP